MSANWVWATGRKDLTPRGPMKQRNLSLVKCQRTMDEILQTYCEKEDITLKELQGGGRTRQISHVRSEIAHALTEELGIPYAEIARQLRVSHVAVSKMMKKESKP